MQSDLSIGQVAPQTHWPELEVLILVVSAEKKAVSSSAGMQTSVKTSDLLKVVSYRCSNLNNQEAQKRLRLLYSVTLS